MLPLSSRGRYAVWIPGILFVLFLTSIRWTSLQPGEEVEQDSFYHMGIADAGPSVYMARTFPLEWSIWKDTFSDKELGFHLLMTAVRSWKALLRGSLAPPFNLESMVCILILSLGFYRAVQTCQIKYSWAPMMMLCCVSSPWINRMLMVRPHVLSVGLMLMTYSLMGRKSWKVCLALGWVYGLCYSNPHFLMIILVAYAISGGIRREWNVWREEIKLIVAGGMGIVLAMLIHPQFPHTFINWKIQSIDVIRHNLIESQDFILTGVELGPPGPAYWNTAVILYGMLILVLFRNGILIWKTPDRRMDRQEWNISLIVLFFAALFPFQLRSIEYWVPFTVLLFFKHFTLNPPNWGSFFPLWRRYGRVLMGGLLTIGMGVTWGSTRANLVRSVKYHAYGELAAYLKSTSIPDGTVIGNVNWSDFPQLYFSMPQYHYLSGMDPMFSFAANPKRMVALERFRTGVKLLSPDQLYQLLQTRFVYVSQYNQGLATDMSKLGYTILYSDRDGYLFDLGKGL